MDRRDPLRWRRTWLSMCLGAMMLQPSHPSWAQHEPDRPPAAAASQADAASAPRAISPSRDTSDRQPWQTLGLRALALAVGAGVAWGLYRIATSCPRPRDD